jgi:hypothetical protein
MKTTSTIVLPCLLSFVFLGVVNAQSQTDSAGDARQRIIAKVERVKEGVHQWAAAGRDPSGIAKTMKEKVKPLLDAGNFSEAETELDRVLEQLNQGAKSAAPQAEHPGRSNSTGGSPEQSFSEFSPDKPQTTVGDFGMQLIFNSLDSPIARIRSKMALVKKLASEWIRRGGDGARLQSLMEKVSQYGSKHHFVEAEKTLDEILSLLGARYTPADNASAEMHLKERDTFIANAKRFNITGIEEYMGLSVVEPEQGKANWGQYRQDAAVIKKAGVKLVAYLWAQAFPKWLKNNSTYVFTSNVATGLETENLSIFAAETLGFYDHFFGDASRELAGLVDIVRIGCPYDYGECGYPAGAGNFQFPKKNLEPGFWVNEVPARAHFKAAMQNKYGTVARLNAAWGTRFVSLETIDYPKDTHNSRYWVDFIHWYQDGFTEQMGKIVALAKKHFPETPININLGWPYEKVNIGQDLSGLAKMAADKGICLRTPTGHMVPFLYTKRVATAARYYPPARFSSEPVGNSAKSEEMALAYFKDLTTGVNWHMDYPGNYERCQDSFAEYRKLWAGAEYPQIDTALFFPTTSHFLDDWDNWRSKGFGGGFPEGLQAYAEELRDMIDYDVVDERLVSDGFLKSYRFLIWPTGKIAEAETLQKVKTWVASGGTLLIAGLEHITTVEQDRGAFESLAILPATDGARQVGKGKVIRIGDKVEDLDGVFPAALDARDGVLVSTFKGGTLLFNKTGQTVVKKMSVKGVPAEITLAPLQLRWIRRP